MRASPRHPRPRAIERFSGCFILLPSSVAVTRCRPCEPLSEVVVHARHPEVRFALEWGAHVMRPVRAVVADLDNRQDEVLGLAERVDALVREVDGLREE